MRVSYAKAFLKDLKQIPIDVQRSFCQVLAEIEAATELLEIRNCKKLKGREDCYRIRIRDHRATFLFVQIDGEIFFQRILSRGQIYKKHIQ